MKDNIDSNKVINKNSFQVDKTVVLCAFGIIVLAAVAVIPPMVRLFIPIDYFEPVITPEVVINEKILTCTKTETDSNQINKTYTENYYLKDDMLYKSETKIIELINEKSLIKRDELIRICNTDVLPYKDINGIIAVCNSEELNQVVRTLSIDYEIVKLEDTINTKTEFVFHSSLEKVKKIKMLNNYTCN